ncbi:hypothetical protein [Gimesia aquarii]|uniref:Uncharacterized protein n=1 Tax=Gimesia aquarii TaxID=2527964 RepID=A0A517WR24_9PLAN|nr:hypothetical protein [Gimesia aquarii]QDU07668.1 hypothetical protein V202x_10280 [Gimesia aquarii]
MTGRIFIVMAIATATTCITHAQEKPVDDSGYPYSILLKRGQDTLVHASDDSIVEYYHPHATDDWKIVMNITPTKERATWVSLGPQGPIRVQGVVILRLEGGGTNDLKLKYRYVKRP